MRPIVTQSFDATRPAFWRVGPVGEALFYYLAIVAVVIFAYGVYQRVRRYTRGSAEPIERLDDPGRRVLRAARTVLANANQFDRDVYAGVMHTFVLWGFLTLFVGTVILGIELDVARRVGLAFWHGDFYLTYSFVLDAFGLLFLVGATMALYRRYSGFDRLRGAHTGLEDHAFVWTLFLLGVGGFLLEGLRILGTGVPSFSTVSFVGHFVSDVYAGLGVTPSMAATAWLSETPDAGSKSSVTAGNCSVRCTASGAVVRRMLARAFSGTCAPPAAGTSSVDSCPGSAWKRGAASRTTRYWFAWS